MNPKVPARVGQQSSLVQNDREGSYYMPKKNIIKKPRAGWRKEGKDNYFYYFKPKVAKRFFLKKIVFLGFKTQPVGLNLYTTGGGFNMRLSNKVGGSHFLTYLKDKYKKLVRLTIYTSGHGSAAFKVQKTVIAISISLDNFKELLKNLGDEIREKKEEVIENRLRAFFPNEFKKNIVGGETINKKLTDINLNLLDSEDHKAVGGFIRRYISLNADNDKVLENLQVDLIIQGKKKTLNQVIKKFEKHIEDDSFDEKKWQKFLHEDVFFFISNYIESIRETDVNFGKEEEGAKKPDFVWIDIYGFLDVFEIKTPYTEILAKRIDKSHKNYYFSKDAAMAISQIEKYIYFIENNVEGYKKYLSKQTKIPFSVLKPKAFLIIGRSKELESNPDKRRDFRLLRRLFKNIEFITFDELLDNLRNLASKFEKQ
jgi:hypothetical protein